MQRWIVPAALLLLHCAVPPTPMLTRAESTDFRETSRHEDVRRMLRELDRHEWARVFEFGRTHEGRGMDALVLSAHGAFTADAARGLGRPVVLILNNIHAGEVCGKEASMMLAREILQGDLGHLAQDLTLLIVPIFNVDGNERVSTENRRLDLENREGQDGPEGGVGIRHTAQGYDLNREYVNQQAVEMRHLTRLYREWDPHLTIDCHTTDGSIHGYHLTYAPPQNPAGHPGPIDYVRSRLLPEVTRRLEARTGFRTFFYGNFRDENDRSQGWETYPALPRFGSHYRGLTNRMDILSEAYSYIPFHDRVTVTYEFVREILEYARENAEEIRRICDAAEADTIAGRPEEVGIRFEMTSWPEPVTILGREGEEWTMPHYSRFVATRTVRRPRAYLIDGNCQAIVDKLRDHGIRVEPLGRTVMLAVETYRVLEVAKIRRGAYVNPNQVDETALRVESGRGQFEFQPETWVVRMDQPLGNLALYLLEPEAEDGLVAWNYFDPWLEVGRPFPVYRVMDPVR